MPCRRGNSPAKTGSSAGTTIDARTRPVQTGPDTPGATQATPSVATASGADAVRRRLSIIFQRPITGSGGRSWPCASRARPTIHGSELPVAARPPVLAGTGLQVVGRVLVEQFDVRDEAGPRKDAFEQVVAQERVVGDAVGHRDLEGIDVVDPLPRVASLSEEVLVDVGDGRGVRVDPGRARIGLLEDRRFMLGRKRAT